MDHDFYEKKMDNLEQILGTGIFVFKDLDELKGFMIIWDDSQT